MTSSAIEDVYPLTPAQQGMLLLTLAETDPAVQVDQSCTALNGPIDASALEGAWQWTVNRHPMLRTTFAWQDLDQPVQAVLPQARVPFQIHDWRGLARKEQETRLAAFLTTDRQEGFVLSDPPLMRLALIRTADAAYRLVWSRHRVLLDGWSTARLMHEVETAYRALAQRQIPVVDPPGAYKEYVTWLYDQDWTAAEAFWGGALRGIEVPTPLGRALPGVAAESSVRYEKATGRLPELTMTALVSMARERRLTLNTLLQGAWAMLLSRYSQRSEVLFGTTVAGRPAELPGVNTALGLFTNTLPMRVTVPPDAGLGSWLAALQAQHLELRRYEYCSAGQVHGWSKVAGGKPLYESIVVFQNYPGSASRDNAASNGGESDDLGTLGLRSDYPLTVHGRTDPGLTLTLVYDTTRLATAEAERVLAHLIALLERIAAKPDSRIGQLVEAVPGDEIPLVHAAPASNRHEIVPFIAPRNDAERAVTGIWCELLGVSEVGVEDNFFALRGHSLLAMRLISRIRDAFQVEIPLSRLFATPTIAGLSQAVEEAILAQIEALSEDEARSQAGGADSPTGSV